MRHQILLAIPAILLLAVDVRASRIEALKPLYPETSIVVGGRSRAVIVTPDDPQVVRTALYLAVQLGRLGGAPPERVPANTIVSQAWQIDFDAIAGRTLVALGNINNNRLLAVLWGEGYVACDSIFPGEGGYVVRTVHDPFARGINVLVLAGSDAAGVRRAAEVFCEKHLPEAPGDILLPAPITDVEFTKTTRRFFPPPPSPLCSLRSTTPCH